MDWIRSLILGVVQGLTEFLPISSDGHLTITNLAFDAYTGKLTSAKDQIFFNIMLHVGTLVAIVMHYRQQVIAGAKGLLDPSAESPMADPELDRIDEDAKVPPAYRRSAVIRVGLLAILATTPLIPDKLFFLKYIEKTFERPLWSGVGFLITAAILLLTMKLKGGKKGPRETTWLDALLVGIAQMFAPLPGVSRSGLTISAALALGFSRTWAVNFSLMMAVPAILGATASELKDLDPKILTGEFVARVVASSVLAGLIGYVAIVWLVRIVRSGRMWYFSVYLILLGIALIVIDPIEKKGAKDDRPEKAADRPTGALAPRPGDRPIADQRPKPLDRAVDDGSRPGHAAAGDPRPGSGRSASLDLGRPLEGSAIGRPTRASFANRAPFGAARSDRKGPTGG